MSASWFFGEGESGHFCIVVFGKKMRAICTRDRRLWIWIYPWISTENL